MGNGIQVVKIKSNEFTLGKLDRNLPETNSKFASEHPSDIEEPD